MKSEPIKTDLCPMIRNGIVARSPSFHCSNMNTIINNPKPTKRPMICDDLQGNLEPPHCIARRRQQHIPKTRKVPPKSSCLSLFFNGSDRSSFPVSLSLRKPMTKPTTTAPIGRLLSKFSNGTCSQRLLPYIQKHHLQLR